MKKKLGVLVLVLSSAVISGACASSGSSSKPKPPQPDSAGHDDTSGELRMNRAGAGPFDILNAAAVPRAATGPKAIDGQLDPAPGRAS
jgi:hypothetical protein